MAQHISRTGGLTLLGAAFLALAGCENLNMAGSDEAATANISSESASLRGATEERDVEAPEVFEAREKGLWDGRPSLGGVWVAHPEVTDPERVLIRNEETGQFVVGALFRRERETPGPRLQVSSEAAEAIGLLAGAPTDLYVVALRREKAPVDPPVVAEEEAPTGGEALSDSDEIETETLDPVASSAASALGLSRPASAPPAARATAAAAPAPAAPAQAPVAVAAPAPTPKPQPVQNAAALVEDMTAPQVARASTAPDKPYVQVGLFSVEENALNTAATMRKSGMVPTVKKQGSGADALWRIVIGPVQNADELDALMAKAKAAGFDDAYTVAN